MKPWVQITAALAVSAIAAYFSIVGLVAVFPGAALAIIAMGIALEAAKIVTANTVFRKWKTLHTLFRIYFVIAAIVLSAITSLGIFGYLSKAHIEHTVQSGVTADAVELVDNQIRIVQQDISTDQQVLKQMDDAVTSLLATATTDSTAVRRAVRLRASNRTERTRLSKELDSLNANLLTLQQQRIQKAQIQRKTDVEVGPLKYLAQMLYGGDSAANTDRAARLLITVLITVFDPLALLLLVSARNEQQQQQVVQDTQPTLPEPPSSPVVAIPQPSVTADKAVVPPPAPVIIGHHRLDALAGRT